MKTNIAMLILMLLPLFADAADLTLPEIIERNTQAVGGREAIEKVQTIRIQVQITEPTFQVRGDYVADRKGRMRIDIYAEGKRVYTEAFDGTKGWQMGGDGVAKESNAKGTAALMHGVQYPGKVFGLHEIVKNGHKLELEGRETVDKVNYYVIQLTLKDGFIKHIYINPDTWMIERERDIRALHPDLDPATKWIENRSYDFQKVEGVLRSFKGEQIDLKTGESMQQTAVQKIEINPHLEDSKFQMP